MFLLSLIISNKNQVFPYNFNAEFWYILITWITVNQKWLVSIIVKIRVRGEVKLLIFGENLSDLSALINLNDLSQISELIFCTFFSVPSDLTEMSISMLISVLTFGTNWSDLSGLINMYFLSQISELIFSTFCSLLSDLKKMSISM